jgi:spore maturation protein B
MFQDILNTVSSYTIPLFLLLIPLYGLIKGVKVYEVFTEGAKEGFTTAITIIPYLLAMLVAIGIFRASGAMTFLIGLLSPITGFLGMPAEVLPLALMRPLSGSGSAGIMNDIFYTHGADSLVGKMASVMQGCTETTFYVLAVYFGAVGIKKIRHALAVGILADIAGILAAVTVSNIMFR